MYLLMDYAFSLRSEKRRRRRRESENIFDQRNLFADAIGMLNLMDANFEWKKNKKFYFGLGFEITGSK